MDTEERILAGEFLSKLGNKKSKFLVQLICDYITANPGVMDPKETIQFIVSSTSVGDTLTEMIRSIIQTELAGKIIAGQPADSGLESETPDTDASIDDMLGNLDLWNPQ
jgi:hypothetical protein